MISQNALDVSWSCVEKCKGNRNYAQAKVHYDGKLKATLESIFDPTTDSLRYYNLGNHYSTRIEHVGAKPALDVEAPLVL